MEFEKKITRLEEIVQRMEGGELALEESLKLFEEGVKLARECQQNLTEAETKIKILIGQDQDSKVVVEDFVPAEN